MTDIFFHNLKATNIRRIGLEEGFLPLNCAQNRLSRRQNAIFNVDQYGWQKQSARSGDLPDMTSETPRTPITFNSVFMKVLPSMKERADLLQGFKSTDLTRSILIINSSLGSRLTIWACIRTCQRSRLHERLFFLTYRESRE